MANVGKAVKLGVLTTCRGCIRIKFSLLLLIRGNRIFDPYVAGGSRVGSYVPG